MLIRCLSGTMADGQKLSPGDVVEVTDSTGWYLCNSKKAELVDEQPKAPETLTTENVTTVKKKRGRPRKVVNDD